MFHSTDVLQSHPYAPFRDARLHRVRTHRVCSAPAFVRRKHGRFVGPPPLRGEEACCFFVRWRWSRSVRWLDRYRSVVYRTWPSRNGASTTVQLPHLVANWEWGLRTIYRTTVYSTAECLCSLLLSSESGLVPRNGPSFTLSSLFFPSRPFAARNENRPLQYMWTGRQCNLTTTAMYF